MTRDDAIDDDVGKWSARRTLAFVVVVCGAFWAAVIWAGFALF